MGHVNEFRPDLLDMLTLRPVEFLPLFEQVRPETPKHMHAGLVRSLASIQD